MAQHSPCHDTQQSETTLCKGTTLKHEQSWHSSHLYTVLVQTCFANPTPHLFVGTSYLAMSVLMSASPHDVQGLLVMIAAPSHRSADAVEVS